MLCGVGRMSSRAPGDVPICVVGCDNGSSSDFDVWSCSGGENAGAGKVTYVDGVVHRRPRSCSIVVLAPGHWTGMYFRRNFRLRNVTLPEPSTLTTYWSNCRTSMTTPVLSHFLGCGPTWFWMRTRSPVLSGGRRLVCSDHFSAHRM